MQNISISKSFQAPVSRLYQAWTNPEDLKNWWHPMGNELTDVTNELKEGGKVAYHFKADGSDENIEVSGTYEKVQPEQELRYSWIWQLPHQPVGNGDYVLNIRFEDKGEESELHVTQENFGSEEAIQPHKEGWEKALNDLKTYLENKQ